MNNFRKRWREWKIQMKVELEDFSHHLKDEYKTHFHPVKTTLVLVVCGFGILMALWNWVSGEPPKENVEPRSNQEVPLEQEKTVSKQLETSDTQPYENEKEARKTAKSFLKVYFNFTADTLPERPEKVREWITGRLYANWKDMSQARPTYDMQSAKLLAVKENQLDVVSDYWYWIGEVELEIENGAGKKHKEKIRVHLMIEMVEGQWRVSEVVESHGTDDGTPGNRE